MKDLFLWIPLFLISIILHELCHGVVAYQLGDATAKEQGRLTLNPFKHLDLFWSVLLPGLLFFSTRGRFAIGMAKPVPVNFSRLRHPKRDMVAVALAGPLANLVLAGGMSLLWKLWGVEFFLYAVYFNLGLALFNLIPIPPLDGSRILAGMLPMPWTIQLFRVERFGFLVILALYFTGFLSFFVIRGVDLLCHFLQVPSLGTHL